MSVVRILQIKCDGCGEVAQGNDPRYNVRALRQLLRTLGWSVRSRNGQGDKEFCPGCVRGTVAEAVRVAEGQPAARQMTRP